MKCFFVTALIIAPLLLSATTPTQEGDGERLPPTTFFEMHIGTMGNYLPGKKQAIEHYREIRRLDPEGAAFLADFWHTKARLEYRQQLREENESYVKKNFTTEEKLKELRENSQYVAYDATKFIFMAYYFDHWDEVSKTLQDRLKELQAMKASTTVVRPPEH